MCTPPASVVVNNSAHAWCIHSQAHQHFRCSIRPLLQASPQTVLAAAVYCWSQSGALSTLLCLIKGAAMMSLDLEV